MESHFLSSGPEAQEALKCVFYEEEWKKFGFHIICGSPWAGFCIAPNKGSSMAEPKNHYFLLLRTFPYYSGKMKK